MRYYIYFLHALQVHLANMAAPPSPKGMGASDCGWLFITDGITPSQQLERLGIAAIHARVRAWSVKMERQCLKPLFGTSRVQNTSTGSRGKDEAGFCCPYFPVHTSLA